jgi:acyl-CoA synthetase (AMP-forming)/AMP-acid ligase II
LISDVSDFAIYVRRTRGELWHLLALPQWYPRFFSGIGYVTRVFDPSAPEGADAFSARVGGGGLAVRDVRFRIRESRPEAEFTIEGIDTSWFASIRLFDAPDGGAHVTAALFKAAQAHPDLAQFDNHAIVEWLRAGIEHAVAYLDGAPTAIASNTGDMPSLSVSVAKKMLTSKVVDVAVRPDRGLRQWHALRRWGFNLAGGYGAARAHSPAGVAIADDYGSHTFDRVHHGADRVAAALHALGVPADRMVAVLARNHAAMVEAIVGCGKLGVDTVLINVGLSARQIQEIVLRHRVVAIFVDDEFDDLVHSLPDRVLRLATRADSLIPGRVTPADSVGDPARSYPPPAQPGTQIVLTSGTSGTPKAAIRPQPKGFGTIAAMLSRLPLRMNDRMFIAAPLFHSWGFAMLQVSTALRATVVLQDRFDAQACLAAIARHRCTSLVVVPIMLQRILDLPTSVRAQYDTSSLRVIVCSGSPLPGSLALRVMDVFGDVLYNFYGSTEVSWATVAGPPELLVAPATAGKPPLGTTVAILDATGTVMPTGAVGRIFVGNEMLFEGYTNAEPPTVANTATTDSLMDTGDLGYLDADGRLFVSGRADEMIISGGENVFPGPVEDALAMLPQVSEVAVIGVPDEEFGQRLAAFVVPHHGVDLDGDMLRRYIRNRLNKYSVPRDIRFLDALPRGATGKILKRLLARGDFDPA